jgi:glycosyltransferase involved in cell wall biosynthesis
MVCVSKNLNKVIYRWSVVAHFLSKSTDQWLDDFIDNEQLVFNKIYSSDDTNNWHTKKGNTTSLMSWVGHFKHAFKAFSGNTSGIITCFPALAMCSAVIKFLLRKKIMIVAYNYNLGAFPSGFKQQIARIVAKKIDKYIVHSPSEITSYAQYLNVPEDRVVFVPLQRGNTPSVKREEDIDNPFIVSMGSASRDYKTLIEAVDKLQIPTIIVTRESDIAKLPASHWVTFHSNLTALECHNLLLKARLSVTPVSNLTTASGQITFIDSMRFGIPTIATRCPGTDGYIIDSVNGMLVEPFDIDSLVTVLDKLWNDKEARLKLATASIKDAKARFTDTSAAARLEQILLELVEDGNL